MIIEMRTYTLKPGNIPTFEERFGGALADPGEVLKLAAFWHTEVGPLNQVIHVWPYEASTNAPRACRGREGGGLAAQHARTHPRAAERDLPARAVLAAARAAAARRHLRDPHVHLCAGHAPAVMERWAEKVPGRIALSPLVGAWHSELGGLNKWCHIWAYKDAAERQRIRAEAVAKGVWPPGGPPGALLKQENMLVVPAAFSPLK